MRALEACGDGFWEFDLQEGSAWFSDWCFRKLAWPPDTKRFTLRDLEPALRPADWKVLMGAIRQHLEQGAPLDLEFEVRVAGDRTERWHLRGAAHRNRAGQPQYLAGSLREVRTAAAGAPRLGCLRDAFEALPVAAALLGPLAQVIEANRQWREYPAAIAAQAAARLRDANSQTAIEFWLDQGPGAERGPRHFRVRAIAFQHDGSRHLAVTLEDRRSD